MSNAEKNNKLPLEQEISKETRRLRLVAARFRDPSLGVEASEPYLLRYFEARQSWQTRYEKALGDANYDEAEMIKSRVLKNIFKLE